MIQQQLVIPSCTTSERAILAAILVDDTVLLTARDIISADDFYDLKHKAIYKGMLALSDSGKRIDTLSLIGELTSRGSIGQAGGEEYILDVQVDIPNTEMVEQHATTIHDKALLRELAISTSNISSQCRVSTSLSPAQLIEQAAQTIYAIDNRRITQAIKPLKEHLTNALHKISVMADNKKDLGLMSGFTELDGMTDGFQPSDLIIVAARPSMGKTAFAFNIAVNAIKENYSVGFFSLEMSAHQLVLRYLSMLTGIPQSRIRNAHVNPDEWMQITYIASSIHSNKLWIDETPALSINDLRAKARRLKREQGLDVLIIDYLQLITTSQRQENRNQEISVISAALKALAKELNIPVIALSQLSRAVEKRGDARPIMSDLRDSGAIEQDADLIMFLYRDVVYNNETLDPKDAELIVSKQRNGPIGTIHLVFNKECTSFENQ